MYLWYLILILCFLCILSEQAEEVVPEVQNPNEYVEEIVEYLRAVAWRLSSKISTQKQTLETQGISMNEYKDQLMSIVGVDFDELPFPQIRFKIDAALSLLESFNKKTTDLLTSTQREAKNVIITSVMLIKDLEQDLIKLDPSVITPELQNRFDHFRALHSFSISQLSQKALFEELISAIDFQRTLIQLNAKLESTKHFKKHESLFLDIIPQDEYRTLLESDELAKVAIYTKYLPELLNKRFEPQKKSETVLYIICSMSIAIWLVPYLPKLLKLRIRIRRRT